MKVFNVVNEMRDEQYVVLAVDKKRSMEIALKDGRATDQEDLKSYELFSNVNTEGIEEV